MPLPQHSSAHSLSLKNKYSLWAERKATLSLTLPAQGETQLLETHHRQHYYEWCISVDCGRHLSGKYRKTFLPAGGLGEKNNVTGGAEKVHLRSLAGGGAAIGIATWLSAGFYGTACRCENFSRRWIIEGLKASMSEVSAWAANYIRIIRAAAAVKINNQSAGCRALCGPPAKKRERPVSSKHSRFYYERTCCLFCVRTERIS